MQADSNNEQQSHAVYLALLTVACLLLVFTFVTLVVLISFVKAFIAYCVIVCIAIGVHQSKAWQHHRHDIKDRLHLRDLAQQALQNGHSVEFTPATRSLRTISPHTIPNGPLTIKDINLGQQALPAALPTAPAFSTIIEQVRDGKWCLGYGEAGAVFGSIDDLLSTAIVGRPGTGKTTLLRFVCAQLLKVGGQPIIWDPHANIADEVSDLLQCSVEPQEIIQSARAVERTLEHRLKERREGQSDFKTFLLLADEWPVIAALAPGAVDVCKRVVLEGRKINMYALISGQGLPAKLLDGTLVRDALSSRYVFNTTAQQARLAGLDNDTANTLLAMLDTAGPGRAILASSRLKPEIISVPDTTVNDMRSCMSPRNGNSRPSALEAFRDVPEQIAFPAQNGLNISSQEREQIVNLWQQGIPRREICGKLGKGNAYYAVVKSVLDNYESEE